MLEMIIIDLEAILKQHPSHEDMAQVAIQTKARAAPMDIHHQSMYSEMVCVPLHILYSMYTLFM